MYGLTPLRFGSVSFVTSSLGPNDPKVGDVIRDNNATYLFVNNVGSSTLSTGLACVVSAVSGYSVTVSSTTSVDVAVGFCQHVDIPTGSYGWVVTRGYCQVTAIASSGTIAAGGSFYLGADGKVAPCSGNSAGNGAVIGKAMAAIVSSASGTAYVNCGF